MTITYSRKEEDISDQTRRRREATRRLKLATHSENQKTPLVAQSHATSPINQKKFAPTIVVANPARQRSSIESIHQEFLERVHDNTMSTSQSCHLRHCKPAPSCTKKSRRRPLRMIPSLATLTSNKMILTTTLSLIVICLASATSVSSQDQFAANVGVSQLQEAQINQQTGPFSSSANSKRPRQFEISTEPNKLARLECKLPQLASNVNRSQQSFYWNFQRISDHNRKPDLLCWGTTCFPDTKKRGIELDFDPLSGSYNLLIRNATYQENDGIYYCDYLDDSSDVKQTTEIQLTVLIPPQPPSIVAPAQNSPKEGQEYQLNCHSHGGNPEPNITWFKGDQVILAGPGVRLEQSRQNGTTTSTLTWIPSIEDHNATYRCSVSNRAMSSPASYEHEITLQVEFAPRISVGPYNPLKVIQGDRATLSCQVDAHPPVKSIKWYKDGNQLISNQYNHTILEVKIQDSGVYSCQADNGIAPVVVFSGSQVNAAGQAAAAAASSSSLFSYLGFGSSSNHEFGSKTLVEARLLLDVQYAPRVQIRESRNQPLSEGDSFTLNCSVDSSPPAYEFVWTKQEDAQTFRRLAASSIPTLEFQTITASDMGNYTCTAYNRLEPSGAHQQVFERQSSASLMVMVRHKPGVAEITVGQQGETELGNRTQLQCRARPPGYPEPKYAFWKWSSSGLDKKQLINKNPSQDYTIFSARSEDEGRYGCLVSNEYGQSNEAVGELIVNEAPSIVPGKTWHDEDTRQPGSFPYSITVQASGKPEPKVAWFHRSPVDGRRIDLSSPEMQSKFRIETQSKAEPLSRHQQQQALAASNGGAASIARHRYIVVSTLTFKQPLEIDDRGLYTVEFSNGLSRSAIESHQLHISHSPIPALKNMPVISNPNQSLQRPNHNHQQVHQPAVTKTRAGFNLGETVNLTCRVSAHPQPQFVWYSQSSGDMDKSLDNNPRFRPSISNPLDDIWEGTLTFQLASEADYGDYMCVTANTDAQTQIVSDSISILIHLGHKTPPEPPLQVEQIDATQDSVTLQWLPGFDGGFALNQFIVQYAPDDGSGLSLMRRYGPLVDQGGQSSLMMVDQSASMNQALVDSQQPQYPKLYDCLSMNPCTINNLQPRQAYLMRLRTRNELGFSEFSDELHVSTRANVSQIPRIQEAHFDMSKNILHYRVEPNPEYLLNSLEIRIEVKSSGIGAANIASNQLDQPGSYSVQPVSSQELTGQSEWRRHLPVPLRHEQGEVYLNMAPDVEMLKLTLCSRSNESLCGQEFLLSTQSAASSFLQDQRGLSMSIIAIVLFLLAVITVMATTLHSRCLSRKAKKAAALARNDHGSSGGHHLHANGHHVGQTDKPSLTGHINAGLSLANGTTKVGSHGSTTSTNSTSATNGAGGNQLQSMDSINQAAAGQHGLNGGSASDHSSDHSRQAKLDSMLPPNYSHYADRASLMLEQQQQHQQAYLQDKLSSPFGLPASALLGQNQLNGANGDPNGQLMSDYFGNGTAGYGQGGMVGAPMSSLEHQQMLEATNGQHPMMMNSVLSYEPNDGQPMYAAHQQALVDDYNYNNALAYANHQDQMIEPAYGTTTGRSDQQASSLMMAQPTQANFDNSANQSLGYLGYPNSTGSSYEQQRQHDMASSQYQHDLAAAQQQMYGTLTRNPTSNNNNDGSQQQTNSSPGQEQQQYMGVAGLMPPPPLPPPPPPQESDYGTTGGARSGGRLIREIIV